MSQAHDVEDLATDRIGEQLYLQMPRDQIEGLTGTAVTERTLWRNLPVEVRVLFRERAERFMAGDLTLLRWARGPFGGLVEVRPLDPA